MGALLVFMVLGDGVLWRTVRYKAVMCVVGSNVVV